MSFTDEQVEALHFERYHHPHPRVPRLNEALRGTRVVLFVDAAHFVFSAFLGYLWCAVRFWVKAPSGRTRLNVLAALNAVTHELTTIANETYINALTVCDLLDAVARRYAGHPITLVLDNARYQHGRLVEQRAAPLQIELLFLPPYSPTLNLIERFWKFVKKRCISSQFYTDFAPFRIAILNGTQTAYKKHEKELASLLTLNFQTFREAHFVTV